MEFMARLSSLAVAVGADVNEVPEPTRARSRGLSSWRHRASARSSTCPEERVPSTLQRAHVPRPHFSARTQSFVPPRSVPPTLPDCRSGRRLAWQPARLAPANAARYWPISPREGGREGVREEVREGGKEGGRCGLHACMHWVWQ
jgi:hypothetical protein